MSVQEDVSGPRASQFLSSGSRNTDLLGVGQRMSRVAGLVQDLQDLFFLMVLMVHSAERSPALCK